MQPVRLARHRADELEDDDVDTLREAAQEQLGDEQPAGREEDLEQRDQHRVPCRDGFGRLGTLGLGHGARHTAGRRGVQESVGWWR